MYSHKNQSDKDYRTLVMLHGNSLDSSVFIPLIKTLDKKIKALAFSLPGHGDSSRPDNYDIGQLKQFVVDNINRLDGEKYILAHSLSGHLVLQSIQRLKDILGIVCIGTPPLDNMDDSTSAFTELGKLMFKETWTESEREEIIESLSNHSQNRIRQILLKSDSKFRKALITPEFPVGFNSEIESLNKTDIPVHLFYSTNDNYINIAYVQKLENILKNPKVRVSYIDYGGHLPFFNHPDNFSKIIDKAILAS
jgi:pimeloyl-ACP methyl ester carboxylesterase